jgi:lipoprotein-releasing system permease protein
VFKAFLSWRYLRCRRTNLIGIIGILVAVAAPITILSIMTGFLEQSRRALRGSLSDLVITPVQATRPDDRVVPARPDALQEVILSDPRVMAASAHFVWYGLIARADGNYEAIFTEGEGRGAGVKLIGIDPEDEFRATDLLEALQRAPLHGALVSDPHRPFDLPPEATEDLPTVIVGEQLFRRYGLSRGKAIEIITSAPGEGGEWRSVRSRFVVAGTFRSGENEMDLERVYFRRADLAALLATGQTFSEIVVRVRDYDADGENLRAELFARLDEEGLILGKAHEVRTWEDFRQVLLGAISNQRVIMGVLLSLVLLVAGFTVFAILSMMVTDRRRDIGVLTALGATPRGVLCVFLMIAFWDALLGAALGALAGWQAALRIDSIERLLSRALGIEIFDRDVYLFDHIPSSVEPVWVTVIVLGAFVCAIGFAAIPALRASRLDPLTSLRYE